MSCSVGARVREGRAVLDVSPAQHRETPDWSKHQRIAARSVWSPSAESQPLCPSPGTWMTELSSHIQSGTTETLWYKQHCFCIYIQHTQHLNTSVVTKPWYGSHVLPLTIKTYFVLLLLGECSCRIWRISHRGVLLRCCLHKNDMDGGTTQK